MKLSLYVVMVFILGYIVARYFPAPANMIGLP